jgi:plasmid stabilization system protein ParE
MKWRIQILDAAKPDFRDIQRYVNTRFGATVWQEVNQEFKNTLRDIFGHPESGTPLEELRAGFASIQTTLGSPNPCDL